MNQDIKAIEEYKQAVLHMLECVSPVVPSHVFKDAVNQVIITRKALGDVDLESLDIGWSKK